VYSCTSPCPQRGGCVLQACDQDTHCPTLHPPPVLQPLDSDTMQQLGRQAKKHGEQLQQAVGGKRRRRGGGAAADSGASSGPPERPLLASVLTRSSIERAASLLHMEAERRGRPELQTLADDRG